ncbi:JAB domain-containing protein [Paracnuella aquatica]|uniref:JAB domain-containing protein n=1 Tax=Paracnuella aquatica TaxID=2268757 RepID=UPI000DEEEEF9|nr:JAB domain-containing protein [Paracnuella aquatica]RPD51421.1 DNA repair protein [Paracnuella aquatica]
MEAVKHVVAEITVAYKPKRSPKDAPQVSSSADAAQHLYEGFNQDLMSLQEQFVVAYLNRGNRIIGLFRASQGGITGTVADPRLILATGLKVAAVAIILAHNHPSGTLRPSAADEELTRKISSAAKFMDIKVLDHLILDAEGSYYSFADEGLL